MEKDLFATKGKKKINTTMYEIGDHDLASYEESFMSFIESLGYTVEFKYKGHPSLGISVNGVEFHINCKNASRTSRNAYTRVTSIRKPINRFITLTNHSHDDNYVVKIFFDKEMDADKIRKKIDDSIAEYHSQELRLENIKAERITNTNLIGQHYINDSTKHFVNKIYISEGTITFTLAIRGWIKIKADNSLIEAALSSEDPPLSTTKMIQEYVSNILSRATRLELLVYGITAAPKLPDNIITWATTQHHQYFDVATMSAEK